MSAYDAGEADAQRKPELVAAKTSPTLEHKQMPTVRTLVCTTNV